MNDSPLVSIVTCNYNSYGYSASAINAFRKIKYSNFRIFVVDDGSSDDSANRLSKDFPDVSIIFNKHLGYCKSFNTGFREALKIGSEYIFMVNNDTIEFSENYLNEIIKVFRKKESIGIVGSICYDKNRRIISNGIEKIRLGVLMDIPTEGFVIKREVFEKIGLLNEYLIIYFEDLDFINRMRKIGFATATASTASFVHIGGGTTSKYEFMRNYYRIRNLILFIKKYCTSKSLKWQTYTFLHELKGHLVRVYRAIRQMQIKTALVISIAIIFGITMGYTLSWRDKNYI